MALDKYIYGIAYRIGENRFHISDIVGYENRLRRAKIPVGPGMGQGYFWTTRCIYRLVEVAIADTLLLSGAPAEIIDHVIICSSHFADPFDQRNREFAAALTANHIHPQGLQGVCGTGCTDVLRGIELACNLLELHSAATILIVGMEASADDRLTSRLLDYALVSDAVVSFLVSSLPASSDHRESLRVMAFKSIAMISRIGSGMSIRDGKEYGRATAAVLESAALPRRAVTKLLGNNTFVPVKFYRETGAGFSKEQLYLDNVERVGHCLACDPILNLVDFDQCYGPGNYILAAEAEGHASAVLLQR